MHFLYDTALKTKGNINVAACAAAQTHTERAGERRKKRRTTKNKRNQQNENILQTPKCRRFARQTERRIRVDATSLQANDTHIVAEWASDAAAAAAAARCR